MDYNTGRFILYKYTGKTPEEGTSHYSSFSLHTLSLLNLSDLIVRATPGSNPAVPAGAGEFG